MTRTVNENIRELEERIKQLLKVDGTLSKYTKNKELATFLLDVLTKDIQKWQQFKEDLENLTKYICCVNGEFMDDYSRKTLQDVVNKIENEIIGVSENE